MCLNNTTEQLHLTDMHRMFHSTVTEYALFLDAQRKFLKINKMLGHKTNLNRFKKTEIIPSIFSNHNGIKLEISNRRKNWKIHEYVEIKQYIPEHLMGQR